MSDVCAALTQTLAARSRALLRSPFVLGVICLMLLALTGTMFAADARADGDPASDVLATQALFLPWDADVPAAEQERLNSLLRNAEHVHYHIRVAMIASSSDLGSVGALWRQPQSYAVFLAQELGLLYHGPLLVVMPDGFGVQHAGVDSAAIRRALRDIPVPHTGAELAEDTLVAMRRLAGADAHPLAVSTAAVPAASPPADLDSAGSWIAFAAGLALIALAWAASLRAQPPGRTHKTRVTHGQPG